MIGYYENPILIIKGDQQDAIRFMLKDRSYALVKNPPKWFLTGVIDVFSFNCGIRELNSDVPIEKCPYCLCLDHNRIDDGWPQERFANEFVQVDNNSTVSIPDLDEFLAFVADKELVFNNHFIDVGGDMESIIRSTITDCFLLIKNHKAELWKKFYDIRIHLTRIGDDASLPVDGLTSADIHDFTLNYRLLDYLQKETKEYWRKDPKDFSLRFESCSDKTAASYFLKCIHPLPKFSLEPIGILCYRFSVLILPNLTTREKAKELTEEEKAFDFVKGIDYKIDSIQINTATCTPSIEELEAELIMDLREMDVD